MQQYIRLHDLYSERPVVLCTVYQTYKSHKRKVCNARVNEDMDTVLCSSMNSFHLSLAENETTYKT